MTSELSSADYQLDFRGQKRPIRPKLLKLTDDGKSRKKSKFKVIIFIYRMYINLHGTQQRQKDTEFISDDAWVEIMRNQFKAI